MMFTLWLLIHDWHIIRRNNGYRPWSATLIYNWLGLPDWYGVKSWQEIRHYKYRHMTCYVYKLCHCMIPHPFFPELLRIKSLNINCFCIPLIHLLLGRDVLYSSNLSLMSCPIVFFQRSNVPILYLSSLPNSLNYSSQNFEAILWSDHLGWIL